MQPPEASTDVHAAGGVCDVRRLLLEHYDRNRRELPWRGELDAYRVWVSEVMLQQTRVETVIPYYRRWMERFPNLGALAYADEDEVLGIWQGLGYYSRARNLHRAAQLIRDRHQGELPRDLSDLQQLPGFGSYTAGAVASIAFRVPAPAVDGNVRRVLSRLYDLSVPSARELTARAARLVDPARPGDFNQALMDLGATVCTPRSPRCGECPLGGHCGAFANGTVHDRPARRIRKAIPERRFAVAVIVDGEARALVVRRPRSGLLGGLWAFPEHEIAADAVATASAGRIALNMALRTKRAGTLTAVKHTFSHFRATYLPVVLRLQQAPSWKSDDQCWVDPSAPVVALPAAQRRIMASLRQWLTGNGRKTRSR